MKSTPDNSLSGGTVPPASFDETLRLLAHAPVPAGLEDRVQAALRAAPRHGRVLRWPHAAGSSAHTGAGAWMRTAAAAAIVFVVAGGGYGVYHRAQAPVIKGTVLPVLQPAAPGGFSAAGAIRTPHTVNGPVLVQPAVKAPAKKSRRKVTPKPAVAAQASPAPAAAVSR